MCKINKDMICLVSFRSKKKDFSSFLLNSASFLNCKFY